MKKYLFLLIGSVYLAHLPITAKAQLDSVSVSGAGINISGAGINNRGEVVVQFGHVPVGHSECHSVEMCRTEGFSDSLSPVPTPYTVSNATATGDCLKFNVVFAPGSSSCDYSSLEHSSEVDGVTVLIKGVGVSQQAWDSRHGAGNNRWRFAEAIVDRYEPYDISVSGNNKNVAWLSRNRTDTTDSFTHYGIGLSGFEQKQCMIDYPYLLSTDDKRVLDPFRGSAPTPGIDRITALGAGPDFFISAQSGGFVAPYQTGLNNTCNFDLSISNEFLSSPRNQLIGDAIEDEFISRFTSSGAGGSPVFCSTGACWSAGGLDCLNSTLPGCESELANTTEFNVEDKSRDLMCRPTCSVPFPSAAESFTTSASGLCSVLADPGSNLIETLVFQPGSKFRMDREHFGQLDGVSLQGKPPEIVKINANNRMVVVSPQSSTGIICDVTEDVDLNECGFTSCREVCHPSFKNASSLSFLANTDNFIITDTLEQRVYLFNENGNLLARWPEDPASTPQCGLVKAIGHPVEPLITLLYRDSNEIVNVRWDGNTLKESIRFNQGQIPLLDNPVAASYAYSMNGTNLYIAMAGSRSVVRLQQWQKSSGTLPIGVMPPDEKLRNATEGVCLVDRIEPVSCSYGDSEQSSLCPTENTTVESSNRQTAIIGGVVGGVAISAVVVVSLVMVIAYSVKRSGAKTTAEGGSTELK